MTPEQWGRYVKRMADAGDAFAMGLVAGFAKMATTIAALIESMGPAVCGKRPVYDKFYRTNPDGTIHHHLVAAREWRRCHRSLTQVKAERLPRGMR